MMTTIKWFEEKTGEGTYQHVSCGYRFEVEDPHVARLLLAEAEAYERMMKEAMGINLFSDAG